MQETAAAEIGLCLLLAAADGEISEPELQALTTRVGELLGEEVAFGRLERVVVGELSRMADRGADEYVAELPSRIPVERRVEALRAACTIACADGLSPEERDMLRDAARALEVDPAPIVASIGLRADEG
jgi:tellurite resistance protein